MKQEYIHFLRFDQSCFDGIEYGYTDLFYKINKSKLFIKEFDHRQESEKEIQFVIENSNVNDKIILENFLLEFLSYSGNFAGEPTYVNSLILSKETFEIILKKAIRLMDDRHKKAILENADNELIEYCKSINLSPQPEGSSPTNWLANCPTGGHHQIMISTKSNQWGCGYCRKKGDLLSLMNWYKNIK